MAEGNKQSQILESEAYKQKQINLAFGEAEAIKLKAIATADALDKISVILKARGEEGRQALNLGVAEKYIDAFGEIAKETNTVVVPSNLSDVSGMVAQVMSVVKGITPK